MSTTGGTVTWVRPLAGSYGGEYDPLKVEANERKHLAGRLPNAEMVANWVAQAKELPPGIEY